MWIVPPYIILSWQMAWWVVSACGSSGAAGTLPSAHALMNATLWVPSAFSEDGSGHPNALISWQMNGWLLTNSNAKLFSVEQIKSKDCRVLNSKLLSTCSGQDVHGATGTLSTLRAYKVARTLDPTLLYQRLLSAEHCYQHGIEYKLSSSSDTTPNASGGDSITSLESCR